MIDPLSWQRPDRPRSGWLRQSGDRLKAMMTPLWMSRALKAARTASREDSEDDYDSVFSDSEPENEDEGEEEVNWRVCSAAR